ncbi:DUF2156 domain-containing protein [Desulfitobacterium sp. Sab5]|uniref:DUF2156 domain-containing protein n=1 Tax=Desulfitobacterium TaxID=36853 RepID=UPI003CEF39BC
MIGFKELTLQDKTWVEPFLATADFRGCHQNFTNIFAWSKIFNYQVARVNDYFIVKGDIEQEGKYYFYPAGSGDLKPVIETMKQDAMECDHKFVLMGVSPENMEVLKSLYPDHFEYRAMRDNFDYLYRLDKLVSLSGNKLHSKRNHINRFKENQKNWSFELISSENMGECWEMNVAWCKANMFKGDDDQIMDELCAVRRCFANYKALGLEGGLLRIDDRVVAFTMGEKLNSDTYDIHVEKAYSEIQGTYQMINREFAEWIQKTHSEIVYVNREEDMGYEGLRKAKLSYHPDLMEEKYKAEWC